MNERVDEWISLESNTANDIAASSWSWSLKIGPADSS